MLRQKMMKETDSVSSEEKATSNQNPDSTLCGQQNKHPLMYLLTMFIAIKWFWSTINLTSFVARHITGLTLTRYLFFPISTEIKGGLIKRYFSLILNMHFFVIYIFVILFVS